MDDRLRRWLTRTLVVLMLITALWGAWVMAKNGGRRGRIGIPKGEDKFTQVIEVNKLNSIYTLFKPAESRGIAV